MAQTPLVESTHPGEYILSESNGNRSRGTGTIATGEVLVAGSVCGAVTASGKYVAVDPAASDGSEVASVISFAGGDATDSDLTGKVFTVRDSEVNADCLVWPDGISVGEKDAAIAELEGAGIIVR